jgi:hypothetical protein
MHFVIIMGIPRWDPSPCDGCEEYFSSSAAAARSSESARLSSIEATKVWTTEVYTSRYQLTITDIDAIITGLITTGSATPYVTTVPKIDQPTATSVPLMVSKTNLIVPTTFATLSKAAEVGSEIAASSNVIDSADTTVTTSITIETIAVDTANTASDLTGSGIVTGLGSVIPADIVTTLTADQIMTIIQPVENDITVTTTKTSGLSSRGRAKLLRRSTRTELPYLFSRICTAASDTNCMKSVTSAISSVSTLISKVRSTTTCTILQVHTVTLTISSVQAVETVTDLTTATEVTTEVALYNSTKTATATATAVSTKAQNGTSLCFANEQMSVVPCASRSTGASGRLSVSLLSIGIAVILGAILIEFA